MKRRVTKIEVQKRHPGRRSIFLDGDFFCGVDQEVLARLDLEVGTEVEEDEICAILQAEERLKAKEYALNLLSYRMRSKHELASRMKQRRFDKETIDEVVQDLEEVGLIDDLEFSKSWIRTRMELNPRSFYALARELRLKGVEREVRELAERDLREEYDEKTVALRIARRRMERLTGEDRADLSRRLKGFLSRRGFSFEVARWVMDKLEEDRRDFD